MENFHYPCPPRNSDVQELDRDRALVTCNFSFFFSLSPVGCTLIRVSGTRGSRVIIGDSVPGAGTVSLPHSVSPFVRVCVGACAACLYVRVCVCAQFYGVRCLLLLSTLCTLRVHRRVHARRTSFMCVCTRALVCTFVRVYMRGGFVNERASSPCICVLPCGTWYRHCVPSEFTKSHANSALPTTLLDVQIAYRDTQC